MPNPQKTTETPNLDPNAAAAAPVDKQIPATAPAAEFIRNLISATPKKVEAKAKAEKEEEDEQGEEGGETKPDAKESKPAPKPKKTVAAPVAQPVIDEEKLGASIGKSIAEHTAKATKDEAKPDKPEVDAKETRRIAVLERMEKIDARYNGLAERYKANKTKLRTYAEEWERANAGEKFDENADEHTDFIEALEAQVAYDDDDYTEALADIRTDQKLESKKSELDERVSRVERAEKTREEAPKIRSAGVVAGNEFWKDMGDDFKGVVDEKGEISAENLKTIADSDPVKYDIAVGAAQAAEATAQTIYMLANGLATYDPQNPTHENLGRFAITQEQEMRKRPLEKQTNEQGQVFASKAEYDRMSKTERAKHWTFSPDDLTYMAVRSISKQAKAHLAAEDEKFSRRAKARGLIADDEKATPKPPTAIKFNRSNLDAEGDEDDSALIGKPLSPSVSSSPKMAAGKSGNANQQQSGAERFVNKLIG